jgi:carboxyl-terminal processing protease
MIVEAIDGRPIREKLSDIQNQLGESSSDRATLIRTFRSLLDGEPNSALNLRLAGSNGKTLGVTLTRRVVSTATRVTAMRLASGVGYIRLNVWRSQAHKNVRRVLGRFRSARGVIIDLRGNPGGEAEEVLETAGYFFTEKVSFGRFISRSGRQIELFTDRDEQIYRGAVVILIDEASGSGSELFAEVMQEQGRARVVGRRSCGCVLGISRFRKVEGGGELAVSELAYISPKGRKIEGEGVIPDETVALRLADLEENRDATLERAERLLLAR